jgi:hypothetical protein
MFSFNIIRQFFGFILSNRFELALIASDKKNGEREPKG